MHSSPLLFGRLAVIEMGKERSKGRLQQQHDRVREKSGEVATIRFTPYLTNKNIPAGDGPKQDVMMSQDAKRFL